MSARLIPLINMADLGEGEMIGGQVGGQAVLLCQVEGRYFAVEDLCSHARQKLSTGRLTGYELRCPLHGARFDVRTGKPATGPAELPIKTFPVTLEGGKVCVSL